MMKMEDKHLKEAQIYNRINSIIRYRKLIEGKNSLKKLGKIEK